MHPRHLSRCRGFLFKGISNFINLTVLSFSLQVTGLKLKNIYAVYMDYACKYLL